MTRQTAGTDHRNVLAQEFPKLSVTAVFLVGHRQETGFVPPKL